MFERFAFQGTAEAALTYLPPSCSAAFALSIFACPPFRTAIAGFNHIDGGAICSRLLEIVEALAPELTYICNVTMEICVSEKIIHVF